MNVPLYEKIWMWAAGGIIAAFIAIVLVTAVGGALQPPSHVETIDPTKVFTDPRFAHPAVTVTANGATVVAFGMMFAFTPAEIHVPAGKPVTFRMTSADVTHGFLIVGTNANTMLVPGYVSQFTTVFQRPGEYLIVCNEYCGLGHHLMSAKLIVEEAKP
ncbi:MAG TPA: cupredoxin domain-containing protein [Gemmatimonadales bacterium]|jgi:cytochrome c oxidase subunit 2